MRYALKLVLWMWAAFVALLGFAAAFDACIYLCLKIGEWLGFGLFGAIAFMVAVTSSLGIFAGGFIIDHLTTITRNTR